MIYLSTVKEILILSDNIYLFTKSIIIRGNYILTRLYQFQGTVSVRSRKYILVQRNILIQGNYIHSRKYSASALTFYRVLRSAPIVVSGLVITSCYVKIYQTIRHHNTAAAPSSQGGHFSYGVEEAKITRMLTVVLIGFYLCYLPPFVTGILSSLTLVGDNSRKYMNFYVTFPLLASSVINPQIYAIMS